MDQMKAKEQSRDNGLRESLAGSMNRSKEAASAASNAMEGVDFKALQSDLSDLKETVAKLVSRAGGEAAKSAREIAGQVSDLAEKGASAASVATDHAKSLVTELENIARRNPLGALAGAVVVGVLIGMMERRR
jgi:ElaB/YqjD/DUF883 family membrane-anchored ribosome-binding protein